MRSLASRVVAERGSDWREYYMVFVCHRLLVGARLLICSFALVGSFAPFAYVYDTVARIFLRYRIQFRVF